MQRPGSLAGAGRPGPARAGDREPLGQRPRRDADRRHPDDRDRLTSASREPVTATESVMPAGDYVAADGERHRHRHGRRDPAAHLRAVLHHQGAGQGHRPGSGDGLRHREAERRLHLRRQRRRAREPFPHLSAPGRGRGGVGEPPVACRSCPPRRKAPILLVEDEEAVRRLARGYSRAWATRCWRRPGRTRRWRWWRGSRRGSTWS